MGKQLYIGQYMVSYILTILCDLLFSLFFVQVRLENLFDDALTVDLEEFLSWAAPGAGKNIEVMSSIEFLRMIITDGSSASP